jgi:hypothetical protein
VSLVELMLADNNVLSVKACSTTFAKFTAGLLLAVSTNPPMGTSMIAS